MHAWFMIQNQKDITMKNRFILFQRSGVFYSEDTTTGKQASLRTKDKTEALRLLHAKNEAVQQPAMNLQIARVYWQHGESLHAAIASTADCPRTRP